MPLQRQLHGGGQAQLGIQRQLVAVGVQQILELRKGKIVLPAAAPQAGKVYVVDPGGLILQGGSTGTDAVDCGGIGAAEQKIPVGEQRGGPHDEGRIAACFAVLLDQQHGGLDLGQRVLLVLAVRAGKDVGEALGVHQKLVAVLGGSGRLAGAVLAVQLQHLAHHLHQLPGLNAGKAVQAVDVLEVVGHVLVHGTALDLRVTGSAADLLRVITQVAGGGKVQHKGNVRDVDAHAKGLGGQHDPALAAAEILQILRFGLAGKLRVVAGHSIAQTLCKAMGVEALQQTDGGKVDQGFLPLLQRGGDLPGQSLELVQLVLPAAGHAGHLPDAQLDVAAAHAAQINDGVRRHVQAAQGLAVHVLLAAIGGRGRKGGGDKGMLVRAVQLLFAQLVHVVTQKPVVRAELFAPGGHNMGFVHDQQADGTVADQVGDIAAAQQGLRRKIQDVAAAFLHLLRNGLFDHGRDVGVDGAGLGVAVLLHALYLIVHQADQRRDHQRDHPVLLGQINGRDLEHHALARTGRCGNEQVAVSLPRAAKLCLLDEVIDDVLLGDGAQLLLAAMQSVQVVDIQRKKVRVTPVLLQKGARLRADGALRLHRLRMRSGKLTGKSASQRRKAVGKTSLIADEAVG